MKMASTAPSAGTTFCVGCRGDEGSGEVCEAEGAARQGKVGLPPTAAAVPRQLCRMHTRLHCRHSSVGAHAKGHHRAAPVFSTSKMM